MKHIITLINLILISSQLLAYNGIPNHKELAEKCLQLAIEAGFIDTSNITHQEILQRLEAGAYNEDFEVIPGIINSHFPEPWKLGPDFNFHDLYPFSKIPYGSINDPSSGWYRGLNHGYDPKQMFKWEGAEEFTIDWANSPENSFTWDMAIKLYREGKKAEAYECLGHVLHLLCDLSVPAHVKLVNHGTSLTDLNSGTIIDPDILTLIVDEYELALSGGLSLPNVAEFIPNLLGDFRKALNKSNPDSIKKYSNWREYFSKLALYTYEHELVNKHFKAPNQNGGWGIMVDKDGNEVEVRQYGITPVDKFEGRWGQIVLKSTKKVDLKTTISKEDMISMSNDLVPKAAEYGAGLLLLFLQEAELTSVNDDVNITGYALHQNYPNPFNPSTTIEFSIPKKSVGYPKKYLILLEMKLQY